MDLSKAFDKVNRAILWATLYKKGPPIQTIQHIRRGRNKTTLQAKYCQQYGNKIQNNFGVSQGSETSALLFIVYLQDMMEDCQAINYLDRIPYRATIQRNEQSKPNTRLDKIETEKTTKANENNTQETEGRNAEQQDIQHILNEHRKDKLRNQLNHTQLEKKLQKTLVKTLQTKDTLEWKNEDAVIYDDDTKLFPPP